MFQPIGEKISVLGIYKEAQFEPKKFKWGSKTFNVEQVTLISNLREGQTKKRMYSVMAQNRLHRLVFNRDTEVWMLEEIWLEG